MLQDIVKGHKSRRGGDIVLAVVVWLAMGTDPTPATELSVLAWCDHLDRALLTPFEERHQVRVNVKSYDVPGTAFATIEQSRPGDWDVFAFDSVDAPRIIAQGLLAPLPREAFDFDRLFPALRDIPLHRQGETLYAMPEKFGYASLAFNATRVESSAIDTLATLWDPRYRGRIAIFDYHVPIINMVAIALGLTPDEITLETLPRIGERLFALRAQAALVGDVISVQTALVTGEVDIVVGGSEYVVANLHAERPELDWTLPRDGGLRWMQSIGVFADSQQPDLALAFVQYFLSPEGQAQLATSTCFWAMPVNRQTPLSESQKQALRWEQQPTYIANSYLQKVPSPELDAAMIELWLEFLSR
ncbi:MAG: extracellular solute-binding protein [Candidatus Competibacterales bacterium]